MAEDPNDWRLKGQERYLQGALLIWSRWAPPINNPAWDHDHCEFCSRKFMAVDATDVLREGFTTEDRFRWICRRCFEDFQSKFQWKLKIEGEAE